MKKVICTAIAGAITLGLCAGCTENSEQGELTPVRLNEVVHSVFYAPQYVAQEKGFFTEEGLEVSVAVGNGADKSMTALISDAADIALLGTEAGLYVYNEGKEDYPKAFLQLTQRAGNFLVSRENESDFEWEDLKGKSVIGGRLGGMPELVLEYVLKENNLKIGEDVEIINNIDFSSTAGAFTGEVGDYTVEFEPVATTLEQSGSGYIVASLGELKCKYAHYILLSVIPDYQFLIPALASLCLSQIITPLHSFNPISCIHLPDKCSIIIRQYPFSFCRPQ